MKSRRRRKACEVPLQRPPVPVYTPVPGTWEALALKIMTPALEHSKFKSKMILSKSLICKPASDLSKNDWIGYFRHEDSLCRLSLSGRLLAFLSHKVLPLEKSTEFRNLFWSPDTQIITPTDVQECLNDIRLDNKLVLSGCLALVQSKLPKSILDKIMDTDSIDDFHDSVIINLIYHCLKWHMYKRLQTLISLFEFTWNQIQYEVGNLLQIDAPCKTKKLRDSHKRLRFLLGTRWGKEVFHFTLNHLPERPSLMTAIILVSSGFSFPDDFYFSRFQSTKIDSQKNESLDLGITMFNKTEPNKEISIKLAGEQDHRSLLTIFNGDLLTPDNSILYSIETYYRHIKPGIRIVYRLHEDDVKCTWMSMKILNSAL